MTDHDFSAWCCNAAPEDRALYERVEDFGDLFKDMLFKPGTGPYDLTKVRTADDNGTWITVGESLPDELEYFDYTCFRFKAEQPADCAGYFNAQEAVLCAPPDAKDSTILHEMVHLHESVINDLPMYFHDMLYWTLYQGLKQRISKLDEIISGHAHMLTESGLYEAGGLHDVLFLLKSFDLDIRKGYDLGVVFGYGRAETLKAYAYTK